MPRRPRAHRPLLRALRATAAGALLLSGAGASPAAAQVPETVIRADRVFDGRDMHEGWAVLVRGDRIVAAGPASSIEAAGAVVVELPGATLLPGLIEGHSHMFLHPYDEVSWNDQVLVESRSERAIRAAQHAESTLRAGFTTARDLGTEGAGYADVRG